MHFGQTIPVKLTSTRCVQEFRQEMMLERCFCCISVLYFQPLNWNLSVTFRYKLVRQLKHVMINVQCVKITE